MGYLLGSIFGSLPLPADLGSIGGQTGTLILYGVGGPATYDTEAQARRAEAEARALLRAGARAGVTVCEFWTEWTTEALWLRPAESRPSRVHRLTVVSETPISTASSRWRT